MAARKTLEIERALTGKGFRKEETHHEMYWLMVEGKRTAIRTRISHGKKEYGENLLGQMARQLRLRRRDFDDLLDCPLSEEGYLKILQDQGTMF
jgi:hypothetical protein